MSTTSGSSTLTGEPAWNSPKHELYFALVAPTGSNTGMFSDALRAALVGKGYDLKTIKLSSLLNEADDAPDWPKYLGSHEDERIKCFQNLGNRLCEKQGSGYAVARLGVAEIADIRRTQNAERGRPSGDPLEATAFLLSSLKRREEVRMLRRLYGPWLFVFGLDTPEAQRQRRLSEIISIDRPSWSEDRIESAATELIGADKQQPGVSWGQSVLTTYPSCDFFIQVPTEDAMQRSVERYIDLLFGDTTVTPTLAEFAMSTAFSTSMRSGSQTRRVGACIVKGDSVVALGVNQLPKGGGGHNFPAEIPESRDETGAYETTKRDIRSVVADLIKHLSASEGILSDTARARANEDIDLFTAELIENQIKDASILDLIEFQRPVHAELSAILDAARRGVSIQGASMYVTTYPCHLCAKELIYAGIGEVIYIEPYPKSHAQAMYSEVISLNSEHGEYHVAFTPYIGVSPRRYTELFEHPNREGRGTEMRSYPLARYGTPLVGIIQREDWYLAELGEPEKDKEGEESK